MSSVIGNPPPGAEEQARLEDEAAAAPPSSPVAMPAPPEAPAAGNGQAPVAHSCRRCGSPLAPGQDWCLQCGAGAPGSLENPRWRSSTAVACGVAVLALGAAAAAYAALNEHAPKPAIVKIAAAPAPSATAPAPTPTPTKTPTPTTPSHARLPIPLQKTKLPKIPLTALKSGTHASSPPSGGATNSGGSTKSGSEGGAGAGEGSPASESSEPAAILLDTDAATTYNPYALPASYFGDPSLTIDGDPSTAWTAEVDPTTAPAMAEGVLLDLDTPHKLSALKLVTQTTGMTVQVYGTTLATPPESILAPEWVALSAPRVVKKHTVRVKLVHPKKAFRYVVLWISKAPANLTGTAQAPARVAVNELEVFPAG